MMKRLKKICVTTLILGMMLPQVLTGGGLSAEAASGKWKHNAKGWWYSYSDGSYAKDWVQISGKWYYFDANGYMVTGWKQIGKKWYFFNSSGLMSTGWKQIDGKWYYFGSNGVMVTGWKKIGGNWYYFPGGAMVTGWKKISGKWYFFDDGAMVIGTKVIGGVEYTFDSEGALVEKMTDLKKAKVGDIITFGKYEQDNNTSNGKEDIEWIVLEKQADGKLLVVSRFGLDCQPYNKKNGVNTWDKSTLRKWLNSTFINAAFTTSEKEKIPEIQLTNDDNRYYGTAGGKDTTDQVFVLSMDEAERYFKDDNTEIGKKDGCSSARACKPTAYAISRGAFTITEENLGGGYKVYAGNCWTWLRSPGNADDTVSNVGPAGIVREMGFEICEVNSNNRVVRPAIVITP